MTKSSLTHFPEDLERQLLACGRDLGAPSPAALARTLARVELAAAAGLFATTAQVNAAAASAELAATTEVVGTGTATITGATVGASASKVAAISLTMKWFVSGLAVGVASSGIVGVGVVARQHWLTPSTTPSAANEPKPTLRYPNGAAASTQAVQHTTVDVSATKVVAVAAAENAVTDKHRLTAVAPSHVNPAREQVTRQSNPTVLSPELARELALLDHARAALERRDAASAASWLERHAEQFPSGQLAPEAAVLRAAVAEQHTHPTHRDSTAK